MTPTQTHHLSTIVLLLLCSVQNFAQDSLGLKQAKNDLEKAILLRDNIDSCLKYGNLVLEYYKGVNKFESAEVARVFHLYGVVYATKGHLSEAKENYFKSIEINERIFGPNHIQIARTYQNLGAVFSVERDFKESDKYHQKALQKAKLYPGKEDIFQATCLTNLAINANAKGLYKQAIDYNLQGLSILSKYPTEGISIAGAFTNISNSHGFMGEYDQAINYALQAIEIKLKVQPNSASLARSYSNLAEWYTAAKQIPKALPYAHKALAIRLNVLGEKHQEVATSFNNFGLMYLELGKFDSAELTLKKAIDLRSKMLPSNHVRIITSKLYYIRCLAKQNKRIEAMNLIKEVAQQFIYRTDYLDNEVMTNINTLIETYFYIDALPAADSVLTAFKKTIDERFSFAGIYSSPLYFNLHEHHGWVLRELYFKDKDLNLLIRAKNSYEKIDSIYEVNKLEFRHSEYVNYLFEKIANNAKNLAYTFALLYQETKDQQYLGATFKLSEKYRSQLLYDHLEDVNLKRLFRVNPIYLQTEQQLDTGISQVLKEIYQEEWVKQAIDPQKIAGYNNRLQALKRQKQALDQQIALEYPEYIKLKSEPSFQDIESIRRSLIGQNHAIIEYISLPNSLCVITITQSVIHAELIKMDEANYQLFNKLRSGIIDFYSADEPVDSILSSGIQNFIESSYALYQILIKPIESQLHKISKITIIPDGPLVGIPFEVLMEFKPELFDRFNTHPYLLKKYIINYAYSANIIAAYTQKLPSEKKGNTFLGFAPFFYGDTTIVAQNYKVHDRRKAIDLDTLKHSAEEVFNARRGWDGKIYVGAHATKGQFLQIADKYKIIHLSTHGQANNQKGEFSYLHFARTKDTLDDEKLYAQEIYNLNLNADLVLLSACESRIGEFSIKDGLIGLAHAFSFAGAKSVVSTLWKVKERQTKELLADFYSKIKPDSKLPIAMTVGNALHFAKLKMLESPRRSHPYFWAGFIAMGDIKLFEN
ncbi:CHAT domain-containing protein [Haliscomenobacter hydrossis]|uniref:Tetratricopeptide TPR_1 repeat-containing protein n=1 Tax=Haliscomenobacter hydrossis (strain ATCC 27775 / DSM 1100 / LMG 10767 / O) TaxID=760192 RepID=F4KQ03_HALH1|nr:CHAT domain-containing tetratricopeptide repeat protein [Haliscomenobacter hydrossis]AEE53207.1 Tetratricopeptide TPR_1 repeat-containing protein [Haliscomenobacter hydrossis DSM 1100]